MAEGEDTEGLSEVMEENAFFENCFRQHDSVQSFLNRDERIYARAVTAEDVEQHVFINYSLDVDGCVVELKSLEGLKLHVRHLTLLANGLLSVREIRSMLNKHVDLSLFSAAELANFRNSVGIQLFYEFGWECWMGLLPDKKTRVHGVRKDILKEQSFLYFKAVKMTFQRRLQALCLSGHAMRTLMKNDLNNIDRMFILPDDTGIILSALQESIDNCQVVFGFRVVLFCFRFGEKMSGGLSLLEFQEADVSRITVHSAMNIESDDMELMWSTAGLQEVVGTRGMLYTCVSFADCCNYRSNLDGRALDISKNLRSVCVDGEKLLFVQLYADLPHRRPSTRFHPVSGCIAGGIVFPQKTAAAYKRDAARYLSTLETNFFLMQRSICRLECVTELHGWRERVMASDCLNVDNVLYLLKQKALLVPFPKGAMKCVQEVGLALTSDLKSLLEKYSGTGNVEGTWKAYQLELAAEKILWGYPLCYRSNQYSVNLGPGKLECSRSRTDYNGFLCLDRWSACMESEDSLPPCQIWTNSEVIANKIRRIAGVHDVIRSGTFVLGRRLLQTLILDCFDIGKLGTCIRYEEYKQELYRDKPKGLPVNGAVTVKQLVSVLSSRRRYPVAMAYGSVCDVLRKSNIELESVIKDGLVQTGFKHFPALQTYDRNRNAILNWSQRFGLWKIIGLGEDDFEFRMSPAVLSMLVVAELEKRRLVFVSKLKKVPSTLPWIQQCARKLHCLKLPDEGLVMVLSFVSCVALLMNGWYIEYDRLEKLIHDMPVNQYSLRDLEIQSKLLLSHFNRFKLFRLHHTITTRIPAADPKSSSVNEVEKEDNIDEHVENLEEVENKHISEEINLRDTESVSLRASTCMPLATKTMQRWSSKEVELLHEVESARTQNSTPKSLYEEFRKKCMEHGIPFRTLKAFEHKLSRI